MTEQVWEGTWEEIKERGESLAGRRVRLILLPGGADKQPNGDNGQGRSELLADLVHQAEGLDAIPADLPQPTDPHEVTFGENVAEKFRKQGFNE